MNPKLSRGKLEVERIKINLVVAATHVDLIIGTERQKVTQATSIILSKKIQRPWRVVLTTMSSFPTEG